MIRTSSILFWFSLIIIASLGLYRTSNRVQELDQHLRSVNAAIEGEKQSIHVLKAEWAYLSSPARIETATRKHLALRPTAPQQVASLDTLSEVLPTRTEAMATVAVNATPVASIRSNITPHVASVSPAAIKVSKAKPVEVAANDSGTNDSGHLRDHMIIVERTASAAPIPGDQIGALISELSSR